MQLPVWMPGLGHVNMYGLVDDRGLAVVDPGLPGPQSWKALKARLRSAGFRMRDVHTVIVTHSHPDHFGGAGRVAKESGSPLVTHHAFSTWTVKGPSPARAISEGDARRVEAEAAAYAQSVDVPPDEISTIATAAPDDPDVVHDDVDEEEPTSRPWGSPTPWGSHNPGPPLKRRLFIRALRLLFAPPEPTLRVHHGARLQLTGREWHAIHTPGHTVDHLCLYDPETGTLLSGDHVLPTITPHIGGFGPYRDPLACFFASLDKVAVHGPDTSICLPAHGHPFTNLTVRVDAIKRHHLERLDTLRSAFDGIGRPASVTELSGHLFSARAQGAMADSETFAHLEHLRLAGEVARIDEPTGYSYVPTT
jgi:glyoxylase-like metal-dependent hydrolase (beta-lactamase superfamily II)